MQHAFTTCVVFVQYQQSSVSSFVLPLSVVVHAIVYNVSQIHAWRLKTHAYSRGRAYEFVVVIFQDAIVPDHKT